MTRRQPPSKDNIQERNLGRITEEMRYVDEMALVVLKGHLIIEEPVDRILETFVFHADHLRQANLRFFQKVLVIRSVSLDEHNNSWDLLYALNELRNAPAHLREPERRAQKVERLKSLYFDIRGNESTDEEKASADHVIAFFALGMLSGFLGSFEEEVVRFKGLVRTLDRVVNPHRHNTKKNPEQPTHKL